MKQIFNYVKNNSLFVHNKFINQLRTILINLEKCNFSKFHKISLDIEMRQILYCVKKIQLIHSKFESQLRNISFNLKKFRSFQLLQKPLQVSK